MSDARAGLYNYAYARVDVKKILDHYRLDYKVRGSEMWMCCPFHAEEDPSFVINKDNKFFTCWGCHEHGNIFSFVKKLDTLSSSSEVSYFDSVMKCCKICNVDVNDDLVSDYVSEMDDDISDIMELYTDTDDYEQAQEIFVDTALFKFYRKRNNYFLRRGFKQETLDYLEMGFLAGDSKDPMNNRCVFPIRNINGELIGWTGRTILSDVNPKWFHAPPRKFKKQYCLYNIDKAIGYVYDLGSINVVESVANVARLIESGRFNTVATLGAGISKFQFDMLASCASKIVFWYDWDNGGFEGIKLALSYTSDYDSIFIAITDYGKDSDGWALDIGDVDNTAIDNTKIISVPEFMVFMERRFVSVMQASFDRDTKLVLPDGSEIVCTNELKDNADIPQLLPEDVVFIQSVDSLFGVKKISVYTGAY